MVDNTEYNLKTINAVHLLIAGSQRINLNEMIWDFLMLLNYF